MSRLGLDSVWWLATPGNPLKINDALPPLAGRMEAARRVANHPRVTVTGLEAEIGTRFTCDTLAWLKRRCPGVHFVWIMGADNLASFHRWRKWREIASLVSIAVIDRPGSTLRGMNTRGGTLLSRHRLDERDARLLADAKRPGFVFLHGPRSDVSSTQLRRSRATR